MGWRQVLECGRSHKWQSTLWSACRVFAPVRALTPHTCQRVAACCGRQRLLEPLATPGRGIAEVKSRNSRRLDLAGQSLLRDLAWARAEGSHRGAPRWAPSRNSLPRLSGTVPRLSETAGRFGAVSTETLRVSIDLNNKFRSLQEAQKRGRKHLSMARSENNVRLQATASRYSPRLIAFLKVACDHFVDAIWNRAKIDRMKGQYAVKLFSGGNGVGRACRLMGLEARSWEMDRFLASQIGTRRWLRRWFQEVTAGNVLCVVVIDAPLLSQHNSHKSLGMVLKILRVCNRKRLPWI